VQFATNGVIFVLLGEQLPALVDGAIQVVGETGHASPWWLAVYVTAVVGALAGLRYAWVAASMRVSAWSARRRGLPHAATDRRVVVAMSLAGVRGAVTLAGILTLPLTLDDGSPFPARDLAIFLAAGVILASLLIASFALPRLLRGIPGAIRTPARHPRAGPPPRPHCAPSRTTAQSKRQSIRTRSCTPPSPPIWPRTTAAASATASLTKAKPGIRRTPTTSSANCA